MLWDLHLHTSFSTDSKTPPDAMAEAAIHMGLNGICLTDHLDYDYPDEPDSFQLDVDTYFAAITELKSQYADTLPIRIGIELGLQPHLARKLEHLTQKYAFDFVIGSSHVVHGLDPYYPKFYGGKMEHEAYREYFESILENLDAFTDFDVYGHIDYIVRYGPNKNREYSYTKYADVIDAILIKLISCGKGIEINTGGFKYGLGHPNPSEDILKRFRELGGEIITVGSDAHAPEHLGYAFEKVPAILRSAGFEYYTIFNNRKPEFLPIPD